MRPALIEQLAVAMTKGGGGTGDVPAGYTYFGQFVDHDLTMDVTDVTLGDNISPAELLQARSPSLDLDSLYGAGPADDESAKFYEADGLHLKVGTTHEDRLGRGEEGPRPAARGEGGREAERRALIPDPRNDENLIVAQTHVAMIRFHNRVVDDSLRPSTVGPAGSSGPAGGDPALPVADPARLPAADRATRPWSTTCSPTAGSWSSRPRPDRRADDAGRVLGRRVPPRAQHDPPGVRLEPEVPGRAGTLDYMFEFSGLGGNLGGEVRLLSNWLADWRRLYDFVGGGHPELAPPQRATSTTRSGSTPG